MKSRYLLSQFPVTNGTSFSLHETKLTATYFSGKRTISGKIINCLANKNPREVKGQFSYLQEAHNLSADKRKRPGV